jgi:hypothetical protein
VNSRVSESSPQNRQARQRSSASRQGCIARLRRAAARWWLAIAWCVAPGLAHAQEAQPDSDQALRWTGAANIATYVVPDDANFVQPTLYADRGRLHLEARYNYEAQKTGSLWVGANFELGERVTLSLTPMFGVVFGETDGVAPGLELTLAVWKLELYSEGEWVIDTGNQADSFYYNWSELSVQLTDWARAGLVAQRTRVYQSDRDIQRGILAGVQWKQVSLTGHVFEPFSDQPTYVISLALEF